MPLDVVIYQIPAHTRSETVCSALAQGIRASGDRVRVYREETYSSPIGDVAVFYGLFNNLERVLRDYPAVGKQAIYVDLGYWGRRAGGRWTGYHKIVLNGRHPTEYFWKTQFPADRLQEHKVRMKPYRKGDFIVLAGMGDKGAIAEGFKPEEWERWAIAELKKHTKRSIIYRPKPSWREAKPIEGVYYSPKSQELDEILRSAHAVVTHHSNVAVDGLVQGVPAFCWHGVARPMALQDLSLIETPLLPEKREEWASNVAYCQWNVAEMRQGKPWRHLKKQRLIE